MTWLLRLAALLAAFLLLRWLWQWFWHSGWKHLFYYTLERAQKPPALPSRHGTIKRDPICGTYVDVEVSVRESGNGDTLHFCSERCRSAYRFRQGIAVQKTR